jgi:hypothetical protein
MKKLPEEVKVALVTAVCLLAIAVLFRNVIQKPMDLLVSIGPFYLFFIYLITRSQAKKAGGSPVKIWNIVIILVTFLIILIYAIK